MIWSVFRRADVDLFTSEENFNCPIYLLKERDALAHKWPSAHLYAFTSIAQKENGTFSLITLLRKDPVKKEYTNKY